MRSILLIFIFIFTALAGAIAQSEWKWTVVMHDGRRYVPVENVSDFYRLNVPLVIGNSFTITGQGRTIKGQDGGHEVYINNVKYVLCFPIVSKGGRLLISAMDVTKIIEPVMRPGKIKNASAVRTVILDAGHGGHDSGATGPYGAEKEAALDVVLRAKALLQANGYNVRLTRSTDVFIPLEQRPGFANKFPNALFISVHLNKSNTVGGTGIETYALAPRGVPSMDEASLSYSDFNLYPGHAHDAENIALATAMHSSMLRHLRFYDRGIKRARFVVIKNLTIPGILVEGGFMNNPVDARQIAGSPYRDEFARAILEGVNRYRNAVAGEMQYFQPTAVVGATDSTTAPLIKRDPVPTPAPTPPPPVGSKTSIDGAVHQAAEALAPIVPTAPN